MAYSKKQSIICKMSTQRITAKRALEVIQNLPMDYSDGGGSDSKKEAMVNAAITSL